jgi:hypothetical protein
VRKKAHGGQSDYRRSPEFRTKADAALARYNASRPFLPKCGARRKRDGEPCRNLAMGNGRCRYHGGRTPSGDGWHRPVWPNGGAPDAERRLARKLQTLERAARKRAARLRRMTDEERQQHEEWHRARPTASAAARAEVKRLKLQARQARSMMGRDAPKAALADPEYLAICERIADLRAQMTALFEDQNKQDEASGADETMEGVFG